MSANRERAPDYGWLVIESEFRSGLPAGFQPPRAVVYEPNQHPPLHTHDFDAIVLITGGVLHLQFGDRTERLMAGDRCVVPAGTPHAETCEAEGATGLLATTPRAT